MATDEVLKGDRPVGVRPPGRARRGPPSATRLCRADLASLYLDDGTGAFALVASDMTATVVDLELQRPHRAGRGSMVGRVMLSSEVEQIRDIRSLTRTYTRRGGQKAATGRCSACRSAAMASSSGCSSSLGRTVALFGEARSLLVATFARPGLGRHRDRPPGGDDRAPADRAARFVSPQIAALISSPRASSSWPAIVARSRRCSSTFADSPISRRPPSQKSSSGCCGTITRHRRPRRRAGGTLEHFAGDGCSCSSTTRSPRMITPAGGHWPSPCERFVGLAEGWHKLGYELGLGVGVSTGYATLGRIGFEGRYDYAAIGNAVILASRLCAEAKAGQICSASGPGRGRGAASRPSPPASSAQGHLPPGRGLRRDQDAQTAVGGVDDRIATLERDYLMRLTAVTEVLRVVSRSTFDLQAVLEAAAENGRAPVSVGRDSRVPRERRRHVSGRRRLG